MTRYKILNTC